MRLLFLRGVAPAWKDEDLFKFRDLATCDDMWLHLVDKFSRGGTGEFVYWGRYKKRQSNYHVKYRRGLHEYWLGSLKSLSFKVLPDVIFSCADYRECGTLIKKFNSAFTIFYGNCKRALPKFGKYDLVLVDSPTDLAKASAAGITAKLWCKPAAENIFMAALSADCEKKFDVAFVADYDATSSRGHRFLLPRLRDLGAKVACVGTFKHEWKHKYPNTTFFGRLPRSEIFKIFSSSKMAVSAYSRAEPLAQSIPEALASGCPVLVHEKARIWPEKYINCETGLLFNDENFSERFHQLLDCCLEMNPRSWYLNNLSLNCAIELLESCLVAGGADDEKRVSGGSLSG